MALGSARKRDRFGLVSLWTAGRRALSGKDAPWLGGWVLLLAAIEVAGRRSPDDAWDLVPASLLLVAAALTLARHRRARLRWLRGLGGARRALRRRVEEAWFELGADLRGTPPVPSGLPGAPVMLVASAAALAALAYGGGAVAGLRALLADRLYVGWLALATTAWLACALAALFFAVLAVLAIHDAFVQRFRGAGRRPVAPELVAILAFFGAVLVLALTTPVELARNAGLLLIATPALAFVPGVPELRMLWRPRAGGDVRAFDGRWAMAFDIALVGCVLALLVQATASGGREGTPVTAALGAFLAWTGAAGLLALAARFAGFLWTAARRDPARRAPRRLTVAGSPSRRALRRVRDELRPEGWRVVRAPRRRRPRAEVRVTVADDAPPCDVRMAPWSTTFGPDALLSDEMRWRLKRRWQVQCRRALLRGLEHLFKRAARREFRNGTGFWVGPHLWFTLGLRRDTDEDEPDFGEASVLEGIVGPPWHRVMPHAARHHLHEILGGVDVDLIYVEDGVGFRRLRRALRRVFEVFDRHDGERRLREHHLNGLRGVSALLVDVELGSPFRREGYAEPDYEDLARARILHLFRERNDGDESLDVPSEDAGRRRPVGAR